jgi:hypothetical protein
MGSPLLEATRIARRTVGDRMVYRSSNSTEFDSNVAQTPDFHRLAVVTMRKTVATKLWVGILTVAAKRKLAPSGHSRAA